MKAYAVRHKETGLFIPRLPSGKRRGGTRLEPSNEREPRLFHNKLSASAFLSNWCQGIMENSGYTNSFGEWDVDLKVIKQPHRNRKNMEIVEFDLIEVK